MASASTFPTQIDTFVTQAEGMKFIAENISHLQNAIVATQMFIKNSLEIYVSQKLSQSGANSAAWQSQMTNQQNQFDAKMADINNWYTGLQNDLALLATYDFNNLTVLNSVEYTWTDLNISPITETIKYKSGINNGKTLATRVTTIGLDPNNAVARERVWITNGTLIRDRTMNMNLADIPAGRIVNIS